MLSQIAIRFVVGGLIVSTFAIIGDLFQPKSFGGLFGAAPSVALATLALTIYSKGTSFAAIEAHSMIGGALALFICTNCISYVLMRSGARALLVSGMSILLWLAVAFGWLVA